MYVHVYYVTLNPIIYLFILKIILVFTESASFLPAAGLLFPDGMNGDEYKQVLIVGLIRDS